MIINFSYSHILIITFCLGSWGCRPSIIELHDVLRIEFYPRKLADRVQTYEICCGSIRGFLLDSSTTNAVDIWVINEYGEFFIPVVLPLDAKEYMDSTVDCRKIVKFDPVKKRIVFQAHNSSPKHIQFDKNLRELVFGLLANERKEKLIIVLEIGGTFNSKSTLHILANFKEKIECG